MTSSYLSFERRPLRLGWGLYVLVLLAAVCLPLSIAESLWLPGAERLLGVVLWSLLAGFLIGHSPFPRWLSWVTGLGVGLTLSMQFTTGVTPALRMALGDLWAGVGWVWQVQFQRQWLTPLPASQALAHVIGQIETTAANFAAWQSAIQTGARSEDLTVMWFLTTFIVWIVSWYAAFELVRSQRALVALAPLGVALVTNVAVTYIGLGYVHIFAALMLIILVYTNASRLHMFWERIGLDFSSELRRDILVAGSVVSAAVLVLALIAPYATYDRAIVLFWDRYGADIQAFYDRLDRAFAGRDPLPPAEDGWLAGGTITRGLLPHEVGGGDRPEEFEVMRVAISDPPPPPPELAEEMAGLQGIDPRRLVERRYWRQRTYDVYTGSGWETSERITTDLIAGEEWLPLTYPHWVVTQTFTLIEPRTNIGFAVNAPLFFVDQDVRVIHRGADDLAAFEIEATEYTVVSYVPQPNTTQLMAAEGDYPEEIAARYLPLPEIPQRVVDRAWQIVNDAGAVTRFEKARAIEAYLRLFQYDLDVEPPPLDRDITDYFIFDLRRGYCDYSATAMTVMLRAVGVAARYASGYSMGRFDATTQQWVVTSRNAHAWTEVYFPELGWIEFEPTPIELTREFALVSGSILPPAMALPLPVTQPESQRFPYWIAGLVLGVVVVALATLLLVSRLRRDTHDTRDLVRRTYGRLLNRARWLNLEPRGGQTPQEYLAYLASEVASRGHAAASAPEDIRLIGGVYLKARYSQVEITEEEGDRVQDAWRRLQGRLVRLVFVRPPNRRPV